MAEAADDREPHAGEAATDHRDLIVPTMTGTESMRFDQDSLRSPISAGNAAARAAAGIETNTRDHVDELRLRATQGAAASRSTRRAVPTTQLLAGYQAQDLT